MCMQKLKHRLNDWLVGFPAPFTHFPTGKANHKCCRLLLM